MVMCRGARTDRQGIISQASTAHRSLPVALNRREEGLEGGFRLVTNIQVSATGNKTHPGGWVQKAAPVELGEKEQGRKNKIHTSWMRLQNRTLTGGGREKGMGEPWIWSIRETTNQTLVWDSGQKPALQSGPKQAGERRVYTGEYYSKGTTCVPRALGSRSSWWLEAHLSPRLVQGSCRCGQKQDAADSSERALTVPSPSGLVQTCKPFRGSTSRQELIRRNWILASTNSSLTQILYITVWFHPCSDSLNQTKRPFVTVCMCVCWGRGPGKPGDVNGNGTG